MWFFHFVVITLLSLHILRGHVCSVCGCGDVLGSRLVLGQVSLRKGIAALSPKCSITVLILIVHILIFVDKFFCADL